MFDIDFFRKNPAPFYNFAREIFPGQFQPSVSHMFIKFLEEEGKLLRNYTQNIDTLEKVAGIEKVVECHGSFAKATCLDCNHEIDSDKIKEDVLQQRVPYCKKCENGVIKPNIVFFGEDLSDKFHLQMGEDQDKVDLLVVIGSSLKVQPVALIPFNVEPNVPQILINREQLTRYQADIKLLGNCDDIIIALCMAIGGTIQQKMVNELSSRSKFSNYIASIAELQQSPLLSFMPKQLSAEEFKKMVQLEEDIETNEPVVKKSKTVDKKEEASMDKNGTEKGANQLLSMWQSNYVSVETRLPPNSTLLVPPNINVFKGAELYYDRDSDIFCRSVGSREHKHFEEDEPEFKGTKGRGLSSHSSSPTSSSSSEGSDSDDDPAPRYNSCPPFMEAETSGAEHVAEIARTLRATSCLEEDSYRTFYSEQKQHTKLKRMIPANHLPRKPTPLTQLRRNTKMLADPRIIRGSVTAKKAEKAEERYKTELIRNRLSMAIGSSRSELSMSTGVGMGTRQEIARLAGPLGFRRAYPPSIGRRLQDSMQEDRRSVPNGPTKQFLQKLDRPKYPATHSTDQRPFPKLPVINASQNSFGPQQKSIDQISFKNVRFEPVRSMDVSSPTVLPQVVPTIPFQSTERGGMRPRERLVKPRRQIYRSMREVSSPWGHNPPSTPLAPPSLNDMYVQTDETFEESFAPLVTEMVTAAIADALRIKLDAMAVRCKDPFLNPIWEPPAGAQGCSYIQKVLEEQKEAAIKQMNALESRKLAVDVIEGMAESSLDELITRNKIKQEVVSRSIAIDTRQFNRQEVKGTLQLQYVYKKAERILVHKIADSYLKDALFSTTSPFDNSPTILSVLKSRNTTNSLEPAKPTKISG
uniref:Deacetylase sirtuin-type domain-containing protein n=1 Tax=Ditylenchus dipsaci TaxID=166011 RepID=A0A915CWR3_9BILA